MRPETREPGHPVSRNGSRDAKSPHRCRCGLSIRPWGRKLLLAAEALEASVEALDAACGVHDALLARVERVGLRGDFDVDDRVGVAVFPLDGLRRRYGGLGQELDAGSQVVENNSFVLRVDIRLHSGTFVHSAGFCQLPGMNGMAAVRIKSKQKTLGGQLSIIADPRARDERRHVRGRSSQNATADA